MAFLQDLKNHMGEEGVRFKTAGELSKKYKHYE